MSGHASHAAVEAAQLSEVAPGVYSYVQPDGTWFINNMGFIAGSSGVVSIDSTSTERRNRAYMDAIASVTSSPVRGPGQHAPPRRPHPRQLLLQRRHGDLARQVP